MVPMKRPLVVISLTLVAMALNSGCTQMTQAEIKFLETRELDLPYEEAYKAAANGLFSLGYTINHSDKESGILSGRRTKKAAKMSVTFLIILPLPTISEGSNNEAITFMVTKLEQAVTLLRMKLVVNGNPIVNRELMTKIWQRIEREAMLDTRPHEETKKPEAASKPDEQQEAATNTS